MKKPIILLMLVTLIFSITFTMCTHTDRWNYEDVDLGEAQTYGTPVTGSTVKILFLHHSTGGCIWGGGVPEWFADYNIANGTDYQITERAYPDGNSYPWDNYPYDYWNIWVDHSGDTQYLDHDTLEIMVDNTWDVIVFKHCYPVSNIGEDTGSPDISSSSKTLENYYLQYNALKDKMHEFPGTDFIVWTGAVQVQNEIFQEEAERMQTFVNWVKNTWDEDGDNIHVWDFYALETDGGLYLKPEYAAGSSDSHPNTIFSQAAAPLFSARVVNVIQGAGDTSNLLGN